MEMIHGSGDEGTFEDGQDIGVWDPPQGFEASKGNPHSL